VSRTRRTKTGPLAKAVELSIAAPQVVALRTTRLTADGRDHAAWLRMGTEKVQAFQESMSAMGLQLWRSNVELALLATRQWWSFWQSAWRWQPFWLVPSNLATQRTLGRSAAALIDRSLAPAHRRVNRNLRRLRSSTKR
jgi:hypothetical protein